MKWDACWRTVCLWLVSILLNPQIVLAQADSQSTTMDIICLTDRPAIAEGDNTRVQAWVVTPDGQPPTQPLSFAWQVTEGTIQGNGPEAQWNLSKVGIASGELHKKVTATVKTMLADKSASSCSVEVFIGKKESPEDIPRGPSDTRGGLRSARLFLLPDDDKQEEPGFGLYSYLLFPAPPGSEEEKTRYLKTLESCLRLMESVEDHIKRHRRPSELNATYIPVNKKPAYSKASAEWANNVLAVYDYAMAQKLLDKLEKEYRRGPYLVSVLNNPLSKRTVPVEEHLLQDFTGKVPDLASRVMDFFIWRAAQQRTWTSVSLRNLELNLRNLVGITSKVAPDVINATITLVQAKQAR